MDEIAKLRKQLKEAEGRVLEEQRRREEAECQREDEQRRREEAEYQREDEQRRREEAEELAKESQPQTLKQYLEACHSLNLAIRVVTDPSLTTKGDTTNPTGRIFPRRIIPWDDFAKSQEDIWDRLSISHSFSSQPAYPSQHQLEYVKSLLNPISSEIGLRYFERDAVENAIQKLVVEAYNDPVLQRSLGLEGIVTFDSHTNLGGTNDSISEPMDGAATETEAEATTPPAPKARRRARGKGNRADQFCIYRTSDGRNIPAVAIEYKAPHKLSIDEVVTGLKSEIQPERDAINKDGQGFIFTARALAAAVVTQLFSYMVGRGIQYGYVCTGQAFVFLYIPDDPTTVYFSVCVPNLDVLEDDETGLHRTAVAQVFAFVLQALRVSPPPESWHDQAESLDTWAVEYDDILRNIPETERKGKEPRASPYQPRRWKGFKRSPISTRSSCRRTDHNVGLPDDDDEDEYPPSPTPNLSRTSENTTPSTGSGSGGGQHRDQQQRQQQSQATKPNIQNRPFCTQQCLLGLAYGGPMDEQCPNRNYHGQGHIDRLKFLRLIRAQLATDRGRDADCVPLHLSGSRGSLFKVRLSTHGYTLVAKGMESLDRAHLQHENEIYDRLRAIQGKYVPVCLGSIDLILPYYYDCGVYVCFMFLSWAGQPLFECNDQANKASIVDGVTRVLKELHKLHVVHGDAEPRNILYDMDSGTLMLVDFERAQFRGCQPLDLISPNAQRSKRKRGMSQKQGKDDFSRELQSALDNVSRYIARLSTSAGMVAIV